MSNADIRAALETAQAAITPSIDTAWENVQFTPTTGQPYQRVHVLFGQPGNEESGGSYSQTGFMQVDLCYPTGAGPAAATARAELIRSTFYRGRTLTANGQDVLINRTPEVLPSHSESDRYVIPVRVPFFAHVEG